MGEVVVEILQIMLPAVLVLVGVIIVFNFFNQREKDKERLEIRSLTVSRVVPLRLQAYERLILFLERISPENLVIRCEGGGKEGKIFLAQLQMEIRAEFEHNYSQQLYVSDASWAEVVKAKEHILSMINLSASELPAQASGIDLGRKILEKMMAAEGAPAHHAIRVLKADFAKSMRV